MARTQPVYLALGDLPSNVQARVHAMAARAFGNHYEVLPNGKDFASKTSGMRYGYLVAFGRFVGLYDCTSDDRDHEVIEFSW